jgi:hypothetical protein
MSVPFREITRHLLMTTCVMSVIHPLFAEDKPAPTLKVKAGVPRGFEAFDQPNETLIDLFYGGLYVGSFRAIYTPKSILFATPEDVVSKIPAIKYDAMPAIKKVLSGEMPTNSQLTCARVPEEGCGKLTPEVAGVIFYEDRFEAELFVNPNLLAEQDYRTEKILPPAPDGFSGTHSLSASATGATGAKRFYSILDNSTIAVGPARINTQFLANNDAERINTLSAGLDKWGLDNRAGFLDGFGMQLIPQVQMTGLSTATSRSTNLLLREISGSRLSLFLPRRSWVTILYKDHVYSTDFYEAGNQILNTDALPEGSYEITVRIRDLSGAQTEEKKFFTKNFDIPPAEQPIYFGQIGLIREQDAEAPFFPRFGKGMVSGAGVVKRLGDDFGVNASFMTLKNQGFTELGTFLLFPPNQQLRLTTLLSSAQDLGFGATYIGHIMDDKISFSGNARTIYSGKEYDRDPVDPITENLNQISGTITFQVTSDANIGFSADYSDTESSKPDFSVGPTLRYDLWRDNSSQLTFTAFSSQTSEGFANGAMINYTLRLGGFNLNSSGTADSGGGQSSTRTGSTRVAYEHSENPGEITAIAAEANHETKTNTYVTDLDHRGSMGNVKLIGSQAHTADGINKFYSGTMSLGVAHTTEDITWGGNEQKSSGIIVKNTGNADNVPMRVVVNGSERETFKTGRSQAVFLNPYDTYKISVAPGDPTNLDYDPNPKRITLYPGNIVPMTWEINKIHIVLGHVVMPDGTPLVNAKLEQGRNITVTDENGMFQGELLNLAKVTFKRNAEKPRESILKNSDVFATLPAQSSKGLAKSDMSPEEQKAALTELYGEIPPLPEGASTVAPTPHDTAQQDIAPPETAPSETASAIQCQATIVKPSEVDELCSALASEYQQACLPKNEHHLFDQIIASAMAAPKAVSTEITTAQADISTEPETPLKPAVHCEVILPEVAPVAGVFIYPEPLKCVPIAENTDPAAPENPADAQSEAPKTTRNGLDNEQVVQLFVDARTTTPRGHRGKKSKLPVLVEPVMPVDVADLPLPATPLLGSKAAVKIRPAPAEQDENPKQVAVRTEPAPEDPMPAPAASSSALPVHYSDGVEVQLGAFRTQQKALEVQEMLMHSFAEFSGKKPYIVRVNLGKLGVFYRLRVSDFSDNREARNFCSTLTSRGQSCFIAIEETHLMPNSEKPEAALESENTSVAATNLSDHYILEAAGN